MNDELHKQLHEMEDQVIEISGLVSALQNLDEDQKSVPVLLGVLEQKLKSHQENFYQHWRQLAALEDS